MGSGYWVWALGAGSGLWVLGLGPEYLVWALGTWSGPRVLGLGPWCCVWAPGAELGELSCPCSNLLQWLSCGLGGAAVPLSLCPHVKMQVVVGLSCNPLVSVWKLSGSADVGGLSPCENTSHPAPPLVTIPWPSVSHTVSATVLETRQGTLPLAPLQCPGQSDRFPCLGSLVL